MVTPPVLLFELSDNAVTAAPIPPPITAATTATGSHVLMPRPRCRSADEAGGGGGGG
jgi:hypothetical protein